MEKIRVLILDDELEILKALKRLLHREYDVDIFTSGTDAIRALEETDFPIIISDMRMPIMDGAEFLEKAHELSPISQKILLTGFSDPEDTSRAVNKGHINFYINKPWQNSEILKVLNDSVSLYERESKRRAAFYNIKVKNKKLEKSASELEVDLLEHETSLNRAEHKNEIALSKIKQTLQRSIDVMGHCIELNQPHLYGHSERVASQVREFARSLQFSPIQISHLAIAARLYRLGLIELPTEITREVTTKLSIDQQIETLDALLTSCEMLNAFVEFSASIDIIQLLHQIEREPSADLSYIDKNVLTSAQILFISSRLDLLMSGQVQPKAMSFADAVDYLKSHHHYIDESLLGQFIALRKTCVSREGIGGEWSLSTHELKPDMAIAQNVVAQRNGQCYLQYPHILSKDDIDKLKKIEANHDSPLIIYIKQ